MIEASATVAARRERLLDLAQPPAGDPRRLGVKGDVGETVGVGGWAGMTLAEIV